ncbi:MAG TPA: lyase family protein, partial [Ilumatobacteraceae bacterium]|nr:lyase family protein [Ilumatobacteraceae bacterium]
MSTDLPIKRPVQALWGPAQALWGPAQALWGKETQHALDNFPVSGRPLPIEIVHALADIKAEAAVVNLMLGAEAVTGRAVSDDDRRRAVAIEAAARAVAMGEYDDQFLIDVFQTGSGTSTNMNVNEVVAALATAACGLAVHPNDDVNRSQSSNDTFPTATTIAV